MSLSHLQSWCPVVHHQNKILGELLDLYEAVTDCLYKKTLKPFYVKGNKVPAMSEIIKQVFKDKRFAHLKTSKYSFQGYVSLWRSANVNRNNSNLCFHCHLWLVSLQAQWQNATLWREAAILWPKWWTFTKRELVSDQMYWLLALVFLVPGLCLIDAIRYAAQRIQRSIQLDRSRAHGSYQLVSHPCCHTT